jgi:outer membrane protein assembly factor BamB
MNPIEDHIPAEEQEQPVSADEQQAPLARVQQRLAEAASVPADQTAPGADGLSVVPNASPRQQSLKRLPGLVAAALIVALLIGSLALLLSQRQPQGAALTSPTGAAGASGLFVVTPDGGSPPFQTPIANPGGPFIAAPPDAAYYLNGYLYQDTRVYNATSGTLATAYQPHLGNLPAFKPQLVNGSVYMLGRVPSTQDIGKATLFALRPADGSVLWQWNDCGESDNMDGPVFIGSAVYLICEASPANWRLVSLQAITGSLLWSEQVPGEPGYPLVGDQQGLYLAVQDQMLAWSPTTGQRLWQRSFVDQGYWINSISLGAGVVYVSERDTFTALATSSGTTLWAYQFRGDYRNITAALAPQTVYLFAYEESRPPTVYAVNSLTGVQRWHRPLPGDVEWPTVDQGNLYMIYNVFSSPQASYAVPDARRLLALSGSDGQTLWQTEIPWNSHHLSYAEIELPFLTSGAGSIYLVDWRGPTSYDPQQETYVMGAFSEQSGALLWSTALG